MQKRETDDCSNPSRRNARKLSGNSYVLQGRIADDANEAVLNNYPSHFKATLSTRIIPVNRNGDILEPRRQDLLRCDHLNSSA